MFTAAVITVSDKGYRGQRADTSGPALCALSADVSGHYFVGHSHHPIPHRYDTPHLDLALWEATGKIVTG